MEQHNTISTELIHNLLSAFYKKALTVNTETTPTAVLSEVLADDFQSINSAVTKSKTELIAQMEGFWKLIPDLKFEPKQKVVQGNHVVIRCVVSGTPRGNFLGVDCAGNKSFVTDSIDIHEIVDGRLARVHHVENWLAALQQLRA